MKMEELAAARREWMKAVDNNCDFYFRTNENTLILHYARRLTSDTVAKLTHLVSLGGRVDVLYYDTVQRKTKVRMREPMGLSKRSPPGPIKLPEGLK